MSRNTWWGKVLRFIAIVLMTLTIQYMMGPTHTWNGINYANAFNTLLTAAGIGLLLLGTAFIGMLRIYQPRMVGRPELVSQISADNFFRRWQISWRIAVITAQLIPILSPTGCETEHTNVVFAAPVEKKRV